MSEDRRLLSIIRLVKSLDVEAIDTIIKYKKNENETRNTSRQSRRKLIEDSTHITLSDLSEVVKPHEQMYLVQHEICDEVRKEYKSYHEYKSFHESLRNKSMICTCDVIEAVSRDKKYVTLIVSDTMRINELAKLLDKYNFVTRIIMIEK